MLRRFFGLPYADHAVVLFAHVGHPFAGRASVRIEELADQPMLWRERGSTTRLALEKSLQAAGVKPQMVMEIGSREALREAVARGLGIGAVSEAEFIPDPRFRMIRLEGAPVVTHTYVYCLAKRREGRLVASFMSVVSQRAGSAV